jgi:hypothetical protein
MAASRFLFILTMSFARGLLAAEAQPRRMRHSSAGRCSRRSGEISGAAGDQALEQSVSRDPSGTVGLLTGVAANEEQILKPEEVLKALAQLPASAWPYGRAVAILVDAKPTSFRAG